MPNIGHGHGGHRIGAGRPKNPVALVPEVLAPVTRTPAGRFLPGISGNPTGAHRPHEGKLLERLYGKGGKKVYARLELIRVDPATPLRLKAEIDMFLVERQNGKAQQRIEHGGAVAVASYVELVLAVMTPPAP